MGSNFNKLTPPGGFFGNYKVIEPFKIGNTLDLDTRKHLATLANQGGSAPVTGSDDPIFSGSLYSTHLFGDLEDGLDFMIVQNIDSNYLNPVDRFTVSMWAKFDFDILDEESTKRLVSYRVNDGFINPISWDFRKGSNRFTIEMYNNSGLAVFATSSVLNLTQSAWYHIALIYSGSGATNADRLKLELNNVPLSINYSLTVPPILKVQSASAQVRFGEFMSGNLDEISFWNAALSHATISEIYNNGTPNDLSLITGSNQLKAWWTMGDGDTIPIIENYASPGINQGILTGSYELQLDTPPT